MRYWLGQAIFLVAALAALTLFAMLSFEMIFVVNGWGPFRWLNFGAAIGYLLAAVFVFVGGRTLRLKLCER